MPQFNIWRTFLSKIAFCNSAWFICWKLVVKCKMHTHSRKLYHLGDYCCSHYILSCEHPDLMEFEFATPLIQTFVIHTIVVWVWDDTNFMSVTIKGCPDRQIWELGRVVLCECWWWWHRWLMVVALTMMTKNVAAENKASKLAWLWDFWGTNKKKDWGRSSLDLHVGVHQLESHCEHRWRCLTLAFSHH